MQDWRDGHVRYLVHFDDGGSGMRHRAEPLPARRRTARDGGARYRVERVEQPPNPSGFGPVWAERVSIA